MNPFNITYIITYHVFDSYKNLIKAGKTKVKNKPNQFVAKVELEKYLRKNVPGFNQLIIIKCEEESMFDFLFK